MMERQLDTVVVLPAQLKAEAGEPAAREAAQTKATELFHGFELELIDVGQSETLIADGEFIDLGAEGRIAYSYRYLVRGTARGK